MGRRARPAGPRRVGRADAEGQYAARRSGRARCVAVREEVKAGQMSLKEFMQAESCMSRSTGTCNVMGTASTMASMVESLGLGLPQNAAIPAVDSRRYAQAHLAGRRIMELVEQDVRISQILTREAFENAIRVNGAVGGPRTRVDPPAGDCRTRGRRDLAQAGTTSGAMFGRRRSDASGRFLMEGFLLRRRSSRVSRTLGENGLLNRDAMTVNGRTHWRNAATPRTSTLRSSARSTGRSLRAAVSRC